MRDTSCIEIDLTAVAENLCAIGRLVGDSTRVCPVIKADAYGLGAVRIARTLVAGGVRMLAVYTKSEAASLLGAGVGASVLVLAPIHDLARTDEMYRGLMHGRVHLALHDLRHLESLRAIASRFAIDLPVHLEVDTGMHRGGCAPADAAQIVAAVREIRHLRLAGIFTHFASAGTDVAQTEEQHARFSEVLASCRALLPADCLVHEANTCATFRDRRFHRTMVRVGGAWAGFGLDRMSGEPLVSPADSLRPVVTWRSRVVQIKQAVQGARVGYGAQWTASEDRDLAIVPVGYADGYPLALSGHGDASGGARVAVRVADSDDDERFHAPVVGAVSMDQLAIDITEVRGRVAVGTVVELISPDRTAPNHLATLARIVPTNPYELLCRLHPTIERVYTMRRAERSDAPLVEAMRGSAVGIVERKPMAVSTSPVETSRIR